MIKTLDDKKSLEYLFDGFVNFKTTSIIVLAYLLVCFLFALFFSIAFDNKFHFFYSVFCGVFTFLIPFLLSYFYSCFRDKYCNDINKVSYFMILGMFYKYLITIALFIICFFELSLLNHVFIISYIKGFIIFYLVYLFFIIKIFNKAAKNINSKKNKYTFS